MLHFMRKELLLRLVGHLTRQALRVFGLGTFIMCSLSHVRGVGIVLLFIFSKLVYYVIWACGLGLIKY